MSTVTPVLKADAAVNNLSEDGVMPLFLYADVQNFNVSYGSGAGTVRYTYVVKNDPIKLYYINCTRGSANVQIYINGDMKKRYIVNAGENKKFNEEFTCNIGDNVTILVSANLAENYARAEGSFKIGY